MGQNVGQVGQNVGQNKKPRGSVELRVDIFPDQVLDVTLPVPDGIEPFQHVCEGHPSPLCIMNACISSRAFFNLSRLLPVIE